MNQVKHPERNLERGTFQFQHRVAVALEKPGKSRRAHLFRSDRIVKAVLFPKPHSRIDRHPGIFFAKSEPGAPPVLGEKSRMGVIRQGLADKVPNVLSVLVGLAGPFGFRMIPHKRRIYALDGSAALVADIRHLALDFEMERAFLFGMFAICPNAHVEPVEASRLFPAQECPARRIQIQVRNPVESAGRDLRIIVLFAVRPKKRADFIRKGNGDVILEFKPFQQAESARLAHFPDPALRWFVTSVRASTPVS